MWRFKQFMPKEPTGLEGQTVDVGNLKIHIRNMIAEGGFSYVYLARDVIHPTNQYALKHIICHDEESLDLVNKEISVMKLLKGHSNVVLLHAHSIFNTGRIKEAFLVMEFCEKSLVSVLENRGTGYFEEKQILLIFRDICNAVLAMHCQSPPIAHRDLKVENVLLGPDGAWKLCDFGSISTNHKRFDRPEEMGIEEDNIRKYTTPAYRAPEMWDLFRKETISEKVDIWALGCLLYRICYLKSAFDGESKLQILNGNYRIPDLPRYGSPIVDLIKDMLQASPDDRPDITQVWFRVDEQLPLELQKQTPDGTNANAHEEGSMPSRRAPRRAPPPPPSSVEPAQNASLSSISIKEPQNSKPSPVTSKAGGGGAPLGAFWSTQHAKDSKGPVFDEDPRGENTLKLAQHGSENHGHVGSVSPPRGQNLRATSQTKRSTYGNTLKSYDDRHSEDFEIRFSSENKDHDSEKNKASSTENVVISKNETFNTFVAEFDTSKLNSGNNRKEELEAEVERLKEQLKQANLEKTEITSKYEKLSAICRSQRQEIQELKQALAARTPSPNKDGSKLQTSPGSWQGSQQREKIEGSVWELQQAMPANSSTPSPDPKPWKAFADEPVQPTPMKSHPRSVRTTNGPGNKQVTLNSSSDTWGFGQDSFTAIPAKSQISFTSDQGSSNSRGISNPKTVEKQHAPPPSGWAGF